MEIQQNYSLFLSHFGVFGICAMLPLLLRVVVWPSSASRSTSRLSSRSVFLSLLSQNEDRKLSASRRSVLLCLSPEPVALLDVPLQLPPLFCCPSSSCLSLSLPVCVSPVCLCTCWFRNIFILFNKLTHNTRLRAVPIQEIFGRDWDFLDLLRKKL